MSRTYSREEVDEILRRAAARAGSSGEPMLTRDELVDAAREAGIDAEAVHRAADEVETGIAAPARLPTEEEAVAAWVAHRRRSFTSHLLTWLVVCAGLMVMNLIGGGPLWFQWPLAGWGIAVALQAIGILRGPTPEQIERVRRRHRKQRKDEQKKLEASSRQAEAHVRAEQKRLAQEQRRGQRARRQEAAGAFEAAVEEGVTALMTVAARTLTEVAQRSRPSERRETEFDRYVARKKRGETPRPQERVPLRVDIAPQAEPERVRFDADDEADVDESRAEARRRR